MKLIDLKIFSDVILGLRIYSRSCEPILMKLLKLTNLKNQIGFPPKSCFDPFSRDQLMVIVSCFIYYHSKLEFQIICRNSIVSCLETSVIL